MQVLAKPRHLPLEEGRLQDSMLQAFSSQAVFLKIMIQNNTLSGKKCTIELTSE